MQIKTSEDEVAACEALLNYALDEWPPDEIERRLGATRDELEGMLDDLQALADRHNFPALA